MGRPLQLTYGFGNINPTLLSILIRPIGYEMYKKMSPEARWIYLKDELKAFKMFLYAKYGGQSNYLREWLRLQGKRKSDYLNELAERRGFKNQTKYLDSRYKLKGFENRAHWQRYTRLINKFPLMNPEDAKTKTLKDLEVEKND